MWLQSDFASWRWWPQCYIINGGVFPDGNYYRPTTKTIRWGRFVFTYEYPSFFYDHLDEGTWTVVNKIPCQVRHWTFPKVSFWYVLSAFLILNWIPGGADRASARSRRKLNVRNT